MDIVSELKAHHFFPASYDFSYNVKVPDVVPFNQDLDYRVVQVGSIGEYTFPPDHYPIRIEDIFVEKVTTRLVLSNRVIYNGGEEDRKSFTYDPNTRKITFKNILKGSHKIHWFDFTKHQLYKGHWRKIPLGSDLSYLNKTYLQGFSKPNPETPKPPNIIDQQGKFQGAFVCHLEINTLPLYGMVCYSDDLKAFMYRGSVQTNKYKDTFQFRLYNNLGQESDPYCAKINMTF